MEFLKALFLRLRVQWLTFRLARSARRLKGFFEEYDSPKSKLKRACAAVEELRAGFWRNQNGQEIYHSPYYISGRLRSITEALEAGFSYREIGTNKEEVIGFRNGEAHKTSARLQLALSRDPKRHPLNHAILELVNDGKFTLEEIGTSKAELDALYRESCRKLYAGSVQRFKKWATRASDTHEKPDEFQEQLTRLLSPEPEGYGFSYEELGTSEEECAELMRLARRREVEGWINFHKSETEKGRTDNSSTRKLLQEALNKAGLTLSDFNITESDLEDRERHAHVAKARKTLAELREPGESYFSSEEDFVVRLFARRMGKIPGDPLGLVMKMNEELAITKMTLADIGTNESEIADLVKARHLAAAKLLLAELEQIAQTPRQTKFARALSVIDPNTHVWDSPSNPIDRTTLEEAYPIDQDIKAIEYHLQGAGIKLEDIGSSPDKLQELRTAIEAR